MEVKILIDDFETLLPKGEHPDIIARNYLAGYELLDLLGRNGELPTIDLYIDQDLGSPNDNETGYDLVCQLEAAILGSDRIEYLPKSMHSMSGDGPTTQVIEKIYAEVNKL